MNFTVVWTPVAVSQLGAEYLRARSDGFGRAVTAAVERID